MTDAGSIALDFISNSIGQIVAILAAVFAAAKWIDKRNQEKIDDASKQLLEKMDNIVKNNNLVKEYMERDIQRLEDVIERLREEKRIDKGIDSTSSYRRHERDYNNPNNDKEGRHYRT